MNDDFERGDRVVLLDRPMGHPTKILGVVVGVIKEDVYNVLLTNGLSKGKIKKVKFFEIRKEASFGFAENKKRSVYNDNFTP